MIFISDRLGKMGVGQKTVLSVKNVSPGTDAWTEDKFLPGDVIEQLRLQSQIVPLVKAPFAGGKTGFCRELRRIASSTEKLYVRVTRLGRKLEITACVAAEESVLRKHYALADYDDRSYIVSFMEATEEECLLVQEQSQKVLGSRNKSRICSAQMKDCLISYSWQQKMRHFLPPPNSAIVFSLLVLPFRPGMEYNGVDDTSARAMAWLSAAQKLGVPIIFVNIQTEPILRQGSNATGFGVGNQEEALSVANSGSYTVHEEAGTEIGVLRGIRLWYAPAASELELNLIPDESDRLGVGISHTEEGFCYVSSVEYGTAADRAGLKEVYESARSSGKVLVISRIAGRKVTPWMVQSSGAIRCFDTLLISEILSLHKQTLQPIQIYVMLWNGFAALPNQNLQEQQEQQQERLSHSNEDDEEMRTSSSSSRGVRWENRNSAAVRRGSNAESHRDSSANNQNSSQCSVRYFNGEESSENEDFSFSF